MKTIRKEKASLGKKIAPASCLSTWAVCFGIYLLGLGNVYAQTIMVPASHGPWQSRNIGGDQFGLHFACGTSAGLEDALQIMLQEFNAYWLPEAPTSLDFCAERSEAVITGQHYVEEPGYCAPNTMLFQQAVCYTTTPNNYMFLPGRALFCPSGYVESWSLVDRKLYCIVKEDDSCPIGNPVSPATGAKIQEEVDYAAPVTSGLEIKRYYFSHGYAVPGGVFRGDNHDYWRFSYERQLTLIQGQSSAAAVIQYANGRRTYFDSTGRELLNKSGGAAARLEPNGASGWRVTMADSSVEIYDQAGKLTSIRSRAGLVVTIAYDANGYMSTVSDAFGHSLQFSFDASGRIISATDPASQLISYSYDGSGRLNSVMYQDGNTKQYHYEGSSPWLMTGITDEQGQRFSTYSYTPDGRVGSEEHSGGANRYEFTYDSAGSAAAIKDPMGMTRNISYANILGTLKVIGSTGGPSAVCGGDASRTFYANGNIYSRYDFNGNQTTYTYDLSRNLETSRIEAYGTPQERTITTQWHPTYRLPQQISEPGRRIDFDYDVSGNLQSRTVVDAVTSNIRAWTYTYNDFGQALTVDGPRTDVNDRTTYAYYTCDTGSQCGHVQTITNALGQTTTFNTYNAHGQPLTITDANGLVTTLTYDTRQRLLSRTVGSQITTIDYWPTGLLKKVTLPDLSFVTYDYDAAHRLTQITDTFDNRVVYTLDAAGNHTTTRVYDAGNVIVRTHGQSFDALGRLAADINASGAASETTTYGYDDNGNATTVNAPIGRNTINAYDALNRLTQVTDAANGITKYEYDANDNLTAVVDPSNLRTTYVYNGFGDLMQQISPDTDMTTNLYDSGGNLKSATDARNQSVTYTYDVLNRVTQASYADQTIGYQYDQGTNGIGRLTQVTNNSGSVGYGYTNLGQIASKTQNMGGVSKTLNYGYNAQGHLSSLTTPSGQSVTYSYTNNLLTGISVNGSPVISQITYEPFGPPRTWTWGNGQLTQRLFDSDGRIVSNSSAGTSTYTYHPDSTIATQSNDSSANLNIPVGVTSFDLSDTSNRLDDATGTLARIYQYDSAGNTTSDGLRSFSYDSVGRMGTAQNGNITSYAYNSLGQRVRKSNSAGTTYFVYDEAGHLAGEYDSSGALIQELVWLDDIPIATIRTDQGGSGVGVFYVHTDHLNAPQKITRPADNAIIWRWDHDPFGNGVPNEDPDGNGLALVFSLRFPGQYYDSETGLIYNWNRYYDPQVGRYVTSDPIGLTGGLNTYAYGSGNPLTYIDPDGLLVIAGDHCSGCHSVMGGPISPTAPSVSESGQQDAARSTTSTAASDTTNCCTYFWDVYKPNDKKHGPEAKPGPRGIQSAEPTNPVSTLASAVPVSEKLKIGYDPFTGQIVLFRLEFTDYKKCVKYWHGFVVSQSNLKPEQWRAGRDAGFPNWPRKPKG